MSQNNLQDYPDHLNPFKSRRGSIAHSFRKVFRSFTGKDKQKPKRRASDVQKHRHTIQSTSSTAQTGFDQIRYTPTALPRSRFKERLEKTDNLKKTKDNLWYQDEHVLEKPSEEQKNGEVPVSPEETPTVPTRSKHRKKKRAAPLPPGATGNDGQYLDVPSTNGSKWSLTSTDTEASSICCSEYEELEYATGKNDGEILEITRKIAELTDDAKQIAIDVNKDAAGAENVDNIAKEEPNIPEIIVEEEELKPIQEEGVQEKKDQADVPHEETVEKVEDLKTEENISKVEEAVSEVEKEVPNVQGEAPEVKEEAPKVEEEIQKIEDETQKIPKNEQGELQTKESLIITEEPLANGVKNYVTDYEEQRMIEKEDLNQNSLVKVRIIDNQEVVLRRPEYESGCPYDESTGERYSLKQKIQHFEACKDDPSPPSKIRQTVLTKDSTVFDNS